MANQIVTQKTWSIDYSGGVKRLRRVKSVAISDESDVETVGAIGEEFHVGFRDKPGGQTLTVSAYDEQGEPEVDWRFLKRSKETFSLTSQASNGQRFQYSTCRVATVGADGDDEGSHMIEVKIVSLTEKEL